MAAIGTLGSVVFTVSRAQVMTFDNMKWESSARYATHARHLKDSVLEYMGADVDRLSFTMYLSVYLGTDPMAGIDTLLAAVRSGEVMRLIVGDKQIGKDKWVIDRLSKDLERFDNKGNLLTAKVTVSLLSYAGR